MIFQNVRSVFVLCFVMIAPYIECSSSASRSYEKRFNDVYINISESILGLRSPRVQSKSEADKSTSVWYWSYVGGKCLESGLKWGVPAAIAGEAATMAFLPKYLWWRANDRSAGLGVGLLTILAMSTVSWAVPGVPAFIYGACNRFIDLRKHADRCPRREYPWKLQYTRVRPDATHVWAQKQFAGMPPEKLKAMIDRDIAMQNNASRRIANAHGNNEELYVDEAWKSILGRTIRENVGFCEQHDVDAQHRCVFYENVSPEGPSAPSDHA